jgi:Protein of unknown function (DUF1257)
MSAYATQTTEFKDAGILCDALTAMGYTVERHTTARQLVGISGDNRPETAEIIIPRESVGRASNEVGFKLQTNGCYQAIISSFDSRHNFTPTVITRLRAQYAETAILQRAKRAGLRFQGKATVNGKIQLLFVKA